MLRRSSERGDAIRQVYRKLGKRHAISQPDEALYDKWTKEWGFTQKTILAACDETTKGVPTFAYLNGILERMRAQGIRDEEGLREDAAMDAAVKEMLREAGMRSVSPNADSRSMLESSWPKAFRARRLCWRRSAWRERAGSSTRCGARWTSGRKPGAMDAQSAHAYLQRVDERRETKSTAERKVNAQQYTQREYTREELDKLFEVL